MSIQKVREALVEAEVTFRFYEQSHLAKKTADGDAKAHRNYEMVQKMRAALALLDDLAKVDEWALPSVFAALTDHGIPTDVQELLLRGDGRGTVAPGAIHAAITAYLSALTETKR